MATHIVTSFNARLYEEYAWRFLRTLATDTRVFIYSEDSIPGVETHNFDGSLQRFVAGNAHRDPPKNYLYDGVRFCYKPAALYTHAEKYTNTDMLWLDADTIFKQPITESWIDQQLRTKQTITYAGRASRHSETGLLFFRMPRAITYIRAVWALYTSNQLWQLPEQHDSYIWDFVRERDRVPAHNLGGPEHPAHSRILDRLFPEHIVHLKGDRKHG